MFELNGRMEEPRILVKLVNMHVCAVNTFKLTRKATKVDNCSHDALPLSRVRHISVQYSDVGTITMLKHSRNRHIQQNHSLARIRRRGGPNNKALHNSPESRHLERRLSRDSPSRGASEPDHASLNGCR